MSCVCHLLRHLHHSENTLVEEGTRASRHAWWRPYRGAMAEGADKGNGG